MKNEKLTLKDSITKLNKIDLKKRDEFKKNFRSFIEELEKIIPNDIVVDSRLYKNSHEKDCHTLITSGLDKKVYFIPNYIDISILKNNKMETNKVELEVYGSELYIKPESLHANLKNSRDKLKDLHIVKLDFQQLSKSLEVLIDNIIDQNEVIESNLTDFYNHYKIKEEE